VVVALDRNAVNVGQPLSAHAVPLRFAKARYPVTWPSPAPVRTTEMFSWEVWHRTRGRVGVEFAFVRACLFAVPVPATPK